MRHSNEGVHGPDDRPSGLSVASTLSFTRVFRAFFKGVSVARIDFVLLCWWPRGRCESEGGHLPSGLAVAASFCFARLLSAFNGVSVARIDFVLTVLVAEWKM